MAAILDDPTLPPPGDPHLPLTERQLAALGRIAVSWSVLDSAIQALLIALSQSPIVLGQALTEDLGQDPRLLALGRLADSFLYACQNVPDEPRIQFLHDVKGLVKWMRSEKAFRNKIAHWIWWAVDLETLYGFKFTIKPQPDAGPTMRVRVDKLNDFVDVVNTKASEAFVLAARAEKLPPWRDINRTSNP